MRRRLVTVVSLVILLLLGWAPWVTEEYALNKVVDSLGGEDRLFNYLGEDMPLKDVPKSYVKVPFGALIYLSSEAVYFVTFFGLVI